MGEWGKVQQRLGRRIAYREHHEDKISDSFLPPLYNEMTKYTKVILAQEHKSYFFS